MNFKTIEELKDAGFVGFKPMEELFSNSSALPSSKGVYVVLNVDQLPTFIEIGTGGFFKGKDPNVSLEYLSRKWLEPAFVLYIGKAGGNESKATLKTRLRQYFAFGQGKNVGHQGGRLIWQLSNSRKLLVCWKALSDDDPRKYEQKLIATFVQKYGVRPFANLVD